MNDESQKIEDLQERVLAGRLLTLVAGKASAALDSSSGWLLAGFGAAFALIFGNLDDVLKFVAPQNLKCALSFYLLALLLGVFEKLLGAIVSSGTTGASEAGAIGRELSDENIDVDFAKVFAEVERATLYPARWLVRRSFAKVIAGDFAAAGRMHAVMSQVQGFLVLGEMICCLAAAITLASPLGT